MCFFIFFFPILFGTFFYVNCVVEFRNYYDKPFIPIIENETSVVDYGRTRRKPFIVGKEEFLTRYNALVVNTTYEDYHWSGFQPTFSYNGSDYFNVSVVEKYSPSVVLPVPFVNNVDDLDYYESIGNETRRLRCHPRIGATWMIGKLKSNHHVYALGGIMLFPLGDTYTATRVQNGQFRANESGFNGVKNENSFISSGRLEAGRSSENSEWTNPFSFWGNMNKGISSLTYSVKEVDWESYSSDRTMAEVTLDVEINCLEFEISTGNVISINETYSVFIGRASMWEEYFSKRNDWYTFVVYHENDNQSWPIFLNVISGNSYEWKSISIPLTLILLLISFPPIVLIIILKLGVLLQHLCLKKHDAKRTSNTVISMGNGKVFFFTYWVLFFALCSLWMLINSVRIFGGVIWGFGCLFDPVDFRFDLAFSHEPFRMFSLFLPTICAVVICVAYGMGCTVSCCTWYTLDEYYKVNPNHLVGKKSLTIIICRILFETLFWAAVCSDLVYILVVDAFLDFSFRVPDIEGDGILSIPIWDGYNILICFTIVLCTRLVFSCFLKDIVRSCKKCHPCQRKEENESKPFIQNMSKSDLIIEPISSSSLVQDFVFDATKSKFLGKGKFSEVYRVQRLENCYEAYKIYHVNYREEERIQDEYAILRFLNHPNIISCNGRTDAGVFLEYCELGDLCKYVFDGEEDITFTTKVDILYQISQAMEYMHLNGCCHRDLKLDNVLLKEGTEGRLVVILTDFNTSKRKKDVMDFGLETAIGTKFYVAPEVIAHLAADEDSETPPPYTAACDVFSFGVCIFILLFEMSQYEMERYFYREMNQLYLNKQWKVKIPKGFVFDEDDKVDAGILIDLIQRCCLYRPKSRPKFSFLRSSLGYLLEKRRKNEEKMEKVRSESFEYGTIQ